MAITLQKIAEAAGVSRGTVDRALNNRGRVRPEVALRIKKIAEELGYQPNRAGRALAMSKRSVKIGVIMQSAETPFFEEVLKGMSDAKEEIEGLGGQVYIKKIQGIHANQIISAMEEMREKQYSGIALTSAEDKTLRNMIDSYQCDYNIPIVTFNADIKDTKRLCFVGQDAVQSGRVAAGLMGELTGGAGKIVILSGHLSNTSLYNRVKGFTEEIKKSYPDIELLDIKYTHDDNGVSKKIMEDLLNEHRDLAGVYITSHGEEGMCKALREKGAAGKVKVIANDFTKENKRNLQDGAIHFLIGQNPYIQGYEPIMVLFRYLFDGISPLEELQYTEIVIKTKYNI